MERYLQEAILETLKGDPSLEVDPDKIFYKVGIRDTPLTPLLCYNLTLEAEQGEINYFRSGILSFDIWEYSSNNLKSLRLAKRIENIFNYSHISVTGGTAVRFRFMHTEEGSVESNRSNKRTEDEYLFKREVLFFMRGYSLASQFVEPPISQPATYYRENNLRYLGKLHQVLEAPDGVRDVFTLPNSPSEIFYFTVNGGPKVYTFSPVGSDQIQLSIAPSIADIVEVYYV